LATAEAPEARADAITEIVDNAIKAKLAAEGKKASREFLAFRRTDVQNGGGSGSSGTTSAVSSPLLPAIFGIAFEDGALTRTVSGSTITIKVSPAGLFCANGVAAAAVATRDPDACKTFRKRFSASAGFDTSRGEKSPALDNLETIRGQFSELSVRGEVINRRRPRPYQDFLTKAGTFADSIARFAGTQRIWTDRVNSELNGLVSSPAWASLETAEREERVAAALDALLADVNVSPSLSAEWLAALKADQRSDFNRAVLTAEYTYQQPDLTTEAIGTDPVIVPAGTRPPGVHTARILYAQGLGDSNLDLAANQRVSWFDEVRTGMRGHLRDVRVGIEGKFKMRTIASYGAPTLSLAGLYVFLNQEPLGLGLTAFNEAKIEERGHIGLFQTKLEFPVANNAIRIPISFSASNRTELIKESEVREQIGISFNLDSLFVEQK
jgi:hypothetical protein